MRISSAWLATGLLLAGASVAAADTVIVTPEDQTVIRDYVVTRKFIRSTHHPASKSPWVLRCRTPSKSIRSTCRS